MAIYVIKCNFKQFQNSDTICGIAICSDPDTPVTFLYPDGKPYPDKDVWSYQLHHFEPWAKLA